MWRVVEAHVGFPKTLSNSCAWNSLLGHYRPTLSYDGISHLSRRSGRGRTSAKNGNVTFWAEKFYVDWCFDLGEFGWYIFFIYTVPFALQLRRITAHLSQVSLKSAWHIFFLCWLHRPFRGRNEWPTWITLAFGLGLRRLLAAVDPTAFHSAEIGNSPHRIT